MAQPGVAGSGPRRSMLVGSTSLALHGAALGVVVAFVGGRIEAPPREDALTPIEVVMAAPPAPPEVARRAQPVPPAATPSPSAVTRTRRAQVPRAVEPSTPAAKQSLADLTVGYDDPTNFVEHARTSVEGGEARRSGIRTSVDHHAGDGVATMQIPQPPVESRARPPRPKFDYTRLRLVGASQFAGHTIKLLLVVDPRGHVREVRLLEGVDRALDRRTVALVRNFEFEPALDDEGVAIRGTKACDIQIVEDEDDNTFKTGLQRHL